MRHLHVRRKRNNSVLFSLEADEKSYQGLSRGILSEIDSRYYLDDSEFEPCRITAKQSENGFLYLICFVACVAFIVWLLGGGC